MLYFRDKPFIRKLPIRLTFFVSIAFVNIAAMKLTADTTNVFNVAFGATATLSSLCFRLSSSINVGDKPEIQNTEHKRRMAYSGERFLHAALIFLIGSILKYSTLTIYDSELIQSMEWLQSCIFVVSSWVSFIVFSWAVYDSHNGARILSEVLWERSYSEEDWDAID